MKNSGQKITLLNRFADSALRLILKHATIKPTSGNAGFLGYYMGQNSSRAYKYLDYAQEGFRMNSTAYACIKIIYESSANHVIRFKKDGEIIDPQKIPPELVPVQRLLTRPLPHMPFDEWFKQIYLYWLIGGISYLYGVNLGIKTIPLDGGEIISRVKTASSLQPLRPDRVEILHEGGSITGYRIDGSKFIEPEKIVYFRFPDPMDEFTGMPPMRAAATAIDRMNESGKFASNLFKNGAKPGGALSFNAPNMTEPEMDDFRAKFQATYAGTENAGLWMLLNTDKMKAAKFSFSPSEMAISEGDLVTLRFVCNAFGVPSPMLGDPETSKYSNYSEAKEDLYVNTSIPMTNHFYGELWNFVAPFYNLDSTQYEMYPDFSELSFLNEDKNAVVERLSKAAWLTDNEKRLEMGYDAIDDPDADIINRPQPMGLFSTDGRREKHQETPLENVHKNSKYKTLESRTAFVNKQEAKRVPFERKIYQAYNEFLKQQEDLMVEWLPKVYSGKGSYEKRFVTADSVVNFFETNKQNQLLFDSLVDLEFSAMASFGQDAMVLAGSSVVFDINRPDLRAWLTEGLTQRSSIINRTTADQLERLLDKAIQEGQGVQEITLRIREQFESISKGRAIAIARTETGMAQSRAQLEGFQQSGTPLHEWVSARDGNVRDSHVLLDGEVVAVGQPFSNGATAPLMSGDPGEDINCRCNTAPLESEDDKI